MSYGISKEEEKERLERFGPYRITSEIMAAAKKVPSRLLFGLLQPPPPRSSFSYRCESHVLVKSLVYLRICTLRRPNQCCDTTNTLLLVIYCLLGIISAFDLFCVTLILYLDLSTSLSALT
jgi:hypothetical protein